MDGRPWAAIDEMGFKMLVGEFSLKYVSATPSFSVLDQTLDALYHEAKADVVKTLKILREGINARGTREGTACGLQLYLTTIDNREFCTASISVIRVGSVRPAHMSLAIKALPKHNKEKDIRQLIAEVRLMQVEY